MAAIGIRDPDTAASLKRKPQGTHQAKSDVQPNTKTQSTGTMHNISENQPKHIDYEQPQRRPVTRDMVKSQTHFATHSGQEITQSNFFEIQTKSASTTVNKSMTKRATSIVSFQNPVVIGNTTVPQTSLRQSARSRNSICGLTVQAEDYSATSKQCQNVLSISDAEGSNMERLVCKNDKMATMSSHVLNKAASFKRKTESTHQAKSYVQPNKKTQSTLTMCDINENQPKHIVEEQSQRKPVTRDMVESQAQFAIHGGQEIIKSNFFEIQTKSASTSVNEAVTKPASSNVSFQNPVIIGKTIVAQTSLRRSAGISNSMNGFADPTEDNSSTYNQQNIKNSQMHTLALKPSDAVNKTIMTTALRSNKSIATPTVNQIATPNTDVDSIDKSCTVNMLESARNKSNATVATDGKLVTIEVPKEHNTIEQLAQLKKYPKVQVHEEILSKVARCNQNVEMAQEPEYESAGENTIHENTISDPSTQTHWKNNLPDHNYSSEINISVEHIPSAESMTPTELTVMEDTLQQGEMKQFDHNKNKTPEDNLDAYVVPSDVLENRCNPPMISAYESRENLLESMTSDHISLQQQINCSTVSGFDQNDDMIIEYESCYNVPSTLKPTEAAILDGTPGEYSKDTMTANNQSNNNTPTCDMVPRCKVNVETTVLDQVSDHEPSSEPQTDINDSNTNLSELHTNNLNDGNNLSRAINMEIVEDVNSNEPGENINDRFANNFRESAEETVKNAPERVLTESCRSNEKNNTLQNREGMSNVQSAEINSNARKENEREKSSRKQHTTESSGSPMQDIVVPKPSLPIPKLSALNKKNSKGETHLHLAVIKKDICVVRSLIVAGTSVNVQDNAGWTALHEACSRGLTDIIQELLKAGADVNCPALNGVSPLQDAVSGSHYEAVKVLLQYGADPMQKNKEGKNAFNEIVNDKIKDLLETHSNHNNSDVIICDEPQPDTDQQQVEDVENEEQAEGTPEDSSASPNLPLGPPPDNRVSCDDNQTSTVLQNDKGLESPHYNISQHESITITLDEIATKQERIVKCELKEPESATQLELELLQMRAVLNEILTKHKVEKEDLVKKFRVSPGSFRQGTLQKQVTALATRQRRFLNLLQKQKTLDHKLREYKLKERQSRQNNIQTQGKRLTCPTESRITPSKAVEFLDQNEGLGAGCATEESEQISIACPARGSECLQPDNFPNQGETNISANQEANTTTAVVDHSTGRDKENVAATNVVDATSSDGSISTISASEPDPSHRESNLLQSRTLEMLQVESLNSNQTETSRDSTPCSNSSQNIHLNIAQSINNPENNAGRVCNPTLVNTEKSTVMRVNLISSNQQRYYLLPAATQPATYMIPINLTKQPNVLKSNLKLNAPQSRIQQQILPFNNAGNSVNSQNIVKVNVSQPDNRGTLLVNNRQVTSNNQVHSLANASGLSGRELNIQSLPVDRGTGQRKLLHLIDLIKHGLIQPGDDVLDLKLLGVCYKADLLDTGIIRDKDRKLYRNPVHWIKELLEEGMPVSRSFAWSKVTYKGKELDKYRTIITTSSKTPETQSIPKPILAIDETSSVTVQNSICADNFSQIQIKKSNSSFMHLREILLIKNEEFLPCHIMNQHWKFYAESDEWNF
ncbi:ankyrin repeat domain-containing protein 31 [Amblyraja radiata]|uniref:ankyrin repeat domain-containing protein 31 n=1 Tax=Amblyraja radiata TaxID=386614 RepID=UPI0014022B45|nr:ankyrin repeat domain-containing protein 31 [Amblyraja radiata]